MRALFLIAGLLASGAAQAQAPPVVPRWRLYGTLASGFGGARANGDTVAAFPTTLVLGGRVWGPLSVDLGATAVLSGAYHACANGPTRPNALFGSAGVRFDLFNSRAASWLDPFAEVHGGVGTQAGADGPCTPAGTFGTGGARLGFDVWLGRVAVTIAGSYDWLPTAAPLALSIGGSFVLW